MAWKGRYRLFYGTMVHQQVRCGKEKSVDFGEELPTLGHNTSDSISQKILQKLAGILHGDLLQSYMFDFKKSIFN